MRVLVLGAAPRLAAPNRLPWLRYTLSALKRLGHDVAFSTYRESWAASSAVASRVSAIPGAPGVLVRYAKAMTRHRDRRAIEVARGFRPQLTIVLKGEVFPTGVFEDVKRLTDGPLTSWWLDDPFAYPDCVRDFAIFDRVFIFDRSYLPDLAAAGAPHASFLPCAYDDTVYTPRRVSAREGRQWATDVAFVASYYPNRAALAGVLAARVDLGVWGNGWASASARSALAGHHGVVRGSGVDDETASRIYSAAKVGLNLHHEQSRLDGLNMRTFELLGTGIAVLTDWLPGLDQLLDPDREVACYRSFAEAQEIAPALVADAARRADMGRRGRARVLAEHTYVARMETLCRVARA